VTIRLRASGNAPRVDATASLLLFAVILGAGWLLPNHYYPWSSFHNEVVAAAGGVMLLIGVIVGRQAIYWPWLALLMLTAAAVPLLQHAAGLVVFRSDALMAALYLVGAALAVAAGATLTGAGHRSTLLDALFGALLSAGIASTGLALCQWFGVTGLGVFIADLPPGGRPYANVGQPNHLATLLAWSVLALLRWYEQRRIGVAGLAIGSAWLLIGLALAQSRTSLVVALLLAGWCWHSRRAIILRTHWMALALGALLLAALMLSVESLSRALLLQGGSIEGRLDLGTRSIHWRTLVSALMQSPLAGYGWNQVVLAQQAAALGEPASHEVIEHSHNLILDLLLWNGVPIGACLIVALAFWLRSALRRSDSSEHWCVVAAIGVVAVHALLEYPLEYAYMLIPTGLWIGCASRLNSDAGGAPRWTLALPATVVTATAIAIALEYVKVEQGVRDARFALAGYARVDELTDLDVELLDGLREYHRYARAQARAGMSAEQLEWTRRVALRYPYPPSMLRAATALALNGREKQAADTLALLCKLHPKARCDEARESWLLLTTQHPHLASVATPFPR
jgi:hypothetical protein